MIPKWKIMKGLKCKCDKCGAVYSADEFDLEEGLCHYCLFPEASNSKSTEMDYSSGEPLNKPRDSLDYLDQVVEKQSKAATAKAKAYKERTYTRRYSKGGTIKSSKLK